MDGAPTGGVETRMVVGGSVGLVVSVLSGLLGVAFVVAAQYGYHEADAGYEGAAPPGWFVATAISLLAGSPALAVVSLNLVRQTPRARATAAVAFYLSAAFWVLVWSAAVLSAALDGNADLGAVAGLLLFTLPSVAVVALVRPTSSDRR